jgi:hypothetical protein
MPTGKSGAPRLKPPESEADHSRLNSDEVKNVWSYISTPPIRLLAARRDTCAFIL